MYSCDKDARKIKAIRSGPRRYGRQVKRSNTSSVIKTDDEEPGFDAKNEINTRAKTIYAGDNL